MLSCFSALTAILLLLTLLPVSRIKHWLVRGLDFPRLQLAVLSALLLFMQLTLLDITEGVSLLLILLNLGCLAVQAWWIWPYTRLHRTEVPPSNTATGNRQTISILTANVLMTNRNAPALIALVQQYNPDVLITLESDMWWQQQLDTLSHDYRHSIKCPQDNLYGMHVYSRLPLHNGVVQHLVEADVPSIHAEVELGNGERVAMHFVHPAPPSPTENESSSERDAELLVLAVSVAQCKQPLIVTGDLNDVAWSETTRLFRKASGLLDPRIGRGMFNSFHAGYPFIRWPLDHLFHSRHFSLTQIKRLPDIGSDHFPLLIALCLESDSTGEQAVTLGPDDIQRLDDDLAEQAVSPEQVHRPERTAGASSVA